MCSTKQKGAQGKWGVGGDSSHLLITPCAHPPLPSIYPPLPPPSTLCCHPSHRPKLAFHLLDAVSGAHHSQRPSSICLWPPYLTFLLLIPPSLKPPHLSPPTNHLHLPLLSTPLPSAPLLPISPASFSPSPPLSIPPPTSFPLFSPLSSWSWRAAGGLSWQRRV